MALPFGLMKDTAAATDDDDERVKLFFENTQASNVLMPVEPIASIIK